MKLDSNTVMFGGRSTFMNLSVNKVRNTCPSEDFDPQLAATHLLYAMFFVQERVVADMGAQARHHVIPTREGRKEMVYLTTHSTHFIYGYMASDIW